MGDGRMWAVPCSLLDHHHPTTWAAWGPSTRRFAFSSRKHAMTDMVLATVRSFHEAVRPVVEALVSSQWFAALPGPARMITLDTVLCSMVRSAQLRSRLARSAIRMRCSSCRDTAQQVHQQEKRLMFPRSGSSCSSGAARPAGKAWQMHKPQKSRSLHDALRPRQARESVYDLLPEPFSDWASVPSSPGPGAPEDEREVFAIAAKLPCRRRGEAGSVSHRPVCWERQIPSRCAAGPQRVCMRALCAGQQMCRCFVQDDQRHDVARVV